MRRPQARLSHTRVLGPQAVSISPQAAKALEPSPRPRRRPPPAPCAAAPARGRRGGARPPCFEPRSQAGFGVALVGARGLQQERRRLPLQRRHAARVVDLDAAQRGGGGVDVDVAG